MNILPEGMAREIFEAAIAEDRCGELLGCLFEGGSATVDAGTGKLVLLYASQIQQLIKGDS